MTSSPYLQINGTNHLALPGPQGPIEYLTHPRVISVEHFCGLDLGQVHDPTALAVLETSEISIGRSLVTYDWITVKRHSFRPLDRLPLVLDYPTIVDNVRRLLSRPHMSHRKT